MIYLYIVASHYWPSQAPCPADSYSKCIFLLGQITTNLGGLHKGFSTEALKDLHSKAKDLSSAVARDPRQLSKARVIDSEKEVRLWDEEERRGSKRQLEQLLGRRKSSHYKKTRPQYQAKGKEIEVNYPREGAGRVPSV